MTTTEDLASREQSSELGTFRAAARPRLPSLRRLASVLFVSALVLVSSTGAATLTVDASCSLADAIVASINDAPTGGCPAGSGADTVELTTDVTLTQTLPTLKREMTLAGHGFAISRDAEAGDFRLMRVASTAVLTLEALRLTKGASQTQGGALWSSGGDVTLIGCEVIGNTAQEGGGAIYNDQGTLTLIDTLMSDNHAGLGGLGSGGGILNEGTLTVTGSTFSNNSAEGSAPGTGGALSNTLSATTMVSNTTFSGNSANTAGGAIAVTGDADPTVEVMLRHVTLAGNTAPLAGGVFVNAQAPAMALEGSLLAGNVAGTGNDCSAGVSTLVDGGGNFSNDTGCGAGFLSISGLDPNLKNNGGPTPTHALLPDSPAIDASVCVFATDQRGVPRDALCDSGAFEHFDDSGGDDDGDGVDDGDDNCAEVPNPGQEDTDADGVGDACDADDDGDGVDDGVDNCPTFPNFDQTDSDTDGAGDFCDACPFDALDDGDGDGLCADLDNCPLNANPTQKDTDADGHGDLCDLCPVDALDDGDGDGLCADADNCPVDPNPDQEDIDSDGLGDLCDPVDDSKASSAGFGEGAGDKVRISDHLVGDLVGGVGWVDGPMGSALEVDGTGFVEIPDEGDSSLDITEALSVGLWINPSSTKGHQVIVSKDDAYELEIGQQGSGRLSVRLGNESRGAANTPLKEDVWQHIAFAWDGETLEYFHNGESDGVQEVVGLLPINDHAMGFGARPGTPSTGGPAFHMQGALDEVEIYDRCLSHDEISQRVNGIDNRPPEASAGAPSGELPEGPSEVTLSLETNEAATCRFATTPGQRFRDMVDTFGATGGTLHQHDLGTLSGDRLHAYYIRCADTKGNTMGQDHLIVFGHDVTTEATAFWMFDEAAGCTVADAQGTWDGALAPSCSDDAPVWRQGRLGTGLGFAGGAQQVLVPHPDELSVLSQLTIAAWISHPRASRFHAIADQRDADTDGFDFFLADDGTLFLRLNELTSQSTNALAPIRWQHIAAVYDGSVVRFYVDGVLDHTETVGTTTLDTTADLHLGRQYASDDYSFAGTLDEVLIYDRALSDTEVHELYLLTQ